MYYVESAAVGHYEKVHPECPDRVLRVYPYLKANGLTKNLIELSPRAATTEQLQKFHTISHVRQVDEDKKNKWNSVYVTPKATAAAARLAAGAATLVTSVVYADKNKEATGIVVTRPPGHHASRDNASGFCLFNNVAVAVANLPPEARVCVLDMDIHSGSDGDHPNAFYDSDRVLTIDIHKYMHGTFFPGGKSGHPSMIGEGAGVGHNVNIAWNHHDPNDVDYNYAFQALVIPLMSLFKPDIVVVSAGMDCVEGDPLGNGASVTPEMYASLLQLVRSKVCAKMVVVLEGGYDCDNICRTFKHILSKFKENEQITTIKFSVLPSQAAQNAVADTLSYL